MRMTADGDAWIHNLSASRSVSSSTRQAQLQGISVDGAHMRDEQAPAWSSPSTCCYFAAGVSVILMHAAEDMVSQGSAHPAT